MLGKNKKDVYPDTTSAEYSKYINKWIKIETIMGGEDYIKEAGKRYLPILSGQNDLDYREYIERGTFYNATKRTSIGLTGTIMRKEPQIECPPLVNRILDKVGSEKQSIQEIVRLVVQNIIDYGYYGILVDAPTITEEEIFAGKPSGQPYMALYSPGTILNHRITFIDGKNKLSMVSLAEKETFVDPDNFFNTLSKDVVRVLQLDKNGILFIQLFEKTEGKEGASWQQVGKDIYPQVMGKKWTEIPFVFFGSVSNTPFPDEPLLMDLANLNLAHWRVTVDYYHGLHYCGMPTPWAAGFGSDAQLRLGGKTAWVSDDPNARCGYLELTGKSIETIKVALNDLEKQMAVIGGRWLEQQKKAAEAAETVSMHYSGDTATLSTVVTSAEQGLRKAINYLSRWLGQEENAEVKLNRDFVSGKMSAQDITALLQALQAGKISIDTFLYNLQRGEILPEMRTIEDEKLLIASSGNDEFENRE